MLKILANDTDYLNSDSPRLVDTLGESFDVVRRRCRGFKYGGQSFIQGNVKMIDGLITEDDSIGEMVEDTGLTSHVVNNYCQIGHGKIAFNMCTTIVNRYIQTVQNKRAAIVKVGLELIEQFRHIRQTYIPELNNFSSRRPWKC